MSQGPFSRYDITRMANPLFSYYQTLVPREYNELIKFINSVILNAPYLIGLAKRYAAVCTTSVDYGAIKKRYSEHFTDVVQERLQDVMESEQVDFSGFQVELFMNLFYYPNIIATIMPEYTYHTECSHCDNKILLSEPMHNHFEFALKLTKKHKKEEVYGLECDYDCPVCGKKNTGGEVVYQTAIASEESPGFFIKLWNPYYARFERGAGRGRTVAVVNIDRFREFYPDRYYNAGVFTFADIDGLDPAFLISVMSNNDYFPNQNMTMVFENKPVIAGLESGLSPALLAMVGLLHTGVLRRGQEADSIIKISPNYMVTPAFGENSAINTRMDGGSVAELAMEMVREIQEGDTLGLGYFPSPMTATKLFPDPRRTVTEKEIHEEEMSTIMTTGMDATIFSGGAGVLNDPFVLHLMKELFAGNNKQIQMFTAKLVKMMNNRIASMGLPVGLKKLPVVRIDQIPGTYIDKEYMSLALDRGMVPLGPALTAKYKFASAREAYQKVLEEQRDRARVDIDYRQKMDGDARSSALVEAATGQLSPALMDTLSRMMIDQAEGMATELSQMDEGEKKSRLAQLQTDNFVLYSVVVKKLEQLRLMREREAKQMVKEEEQR